MDNINNPQSNNPVNTNMGTNFGGPKNLPNSIAVLVLGICSIFPGCFCYGIVGIICGIIALVLAKKDLAAYAANPTAYTEGSLKNLKAGRVCGIIGLCLSSLYVIFLIVYVLVLGAALTAMPWGNFH
jgi:hypothetical protein